MPETAPPKSLLIIEDDLSLIELINSVIEHVRPGLEWEYVTSGEQALERIRERGTSRGRAPYNLVMADIYLDGDLTGVDVLRDCQRTYPDMPFVVTSGLSTDRYHTILDDLDRPPVFLPKPLTANRCRPVFEEYLT